MLFDVITQDYGVLRGTRMLQVRFTSEEEIDNEKALQCILAEALKESVAWIYFYDKNKDPAKLPLTELICDLPFDVCVETRGEGKYANIMNARHIILHLCDYVKEFPEGVYQEVWLHTPGHDSHIMSAQHSSSCIYAKGYAQDVERLQRIYPQIRRWSEK